ncbi:methyltransferase [Methylobacterium sp. BTF04]|uniref:tRNA1(Val) (adenine(37)-N6)-methyltransferase n=1 Tax=Methylobacterium sp. BTF04 TaxID=2708300 RepID=UPI0013D11E71|nr:methyltransferase [Methylobacterium sp. BTF04]NEU12026.1 methyltransferase [Methylobacterium sp. BTF04]
MPEADETDIDVWLGGALRLAQPARGGHRAGTDAVLLGGLIAPHAGEVVYDIGAGTGAVGLAVASRVPECRIVLVERDPGFADLARRNIERNGFAARAAVIEADVLASGTRRKADGLVGGLADLVLTNPPFFEAGAHRPSPVAAKASAHTFEGGGLDAWLRTCVDLLKPNGRLGLIHRADALPACLDGLRGRFGSIVVRPVQARIERPAIRILITAVKGSRGPFALRPPLVLQTADGSFTPQVAALNEGRGWIEP